MKWKFLTVKLKINFIKLEYGLKRLKEEGEKWKWFQLIIRMGDMKVKSKMEEGMDMEYLGMRPIGKYIQDNGKMIENMEKEFS